MTHYTDPFESMRGYTWDIEPGEMIVSIYKKENGKRGPRVMSFFLGEAMEVAGRKNIMEHVRECDNSPWLKYWGADEAIIEKLKGK